jgi:serine/threonine protein kinase/Flp pilus assembly protein TadD
VRRKERYRLLKLIGQGGTGAVYKAEDLELGRIVALKLLHPMLAGDERYVNLLKREVVIASQITHPNIVRVFDVGNLRSSPVITMAFIQGENLAALLNREGALSTPRIIHFCRQICPALDEAHRRGIVHRDLKPQNLLIDHQGEIYISDFGLAHELASNNREAIESSSRPGTLRYMSPEQFHALACDPRSDIYSFGLILYEMLTGLALDVDHDATGSVAVDRSTGLPADLPPTVSAPLAAIALRCLAQNPVERYQSASEILASLPVNAPRLENPAPADAADAPGLAADCSPARDLGSHPITRIAGAACLALLAASALWWSWRPHKVSASVSFDQLYKQASAQLQNYDDPSSLKRASGLFQSAASIKPAAVVFEGLAKAQFRLFQLESDSHRLREARAAMERVENLNPKSHATALLHAEIEMAEGASAAAATRLIRLLDSEPPSDDVCRALAKAQLLMGHAPEAVGSWTRAISLNPGYWVNHNGFGAALMKLGRPDQAQAEFRKVIALNPGSHVGYANLGAAYLGSGEFRKAIAVTNKSLTIQSTAWQYNNLGTAFYYTGSTHAAIQLFLKAVELNPRSDLYQGNLGEAYRTAGDTQRARAAYVNAVPLAEDALRVSPNNARLMARLAVFLAKAGRIQEASAQLSSALANSPENPEILYSKAQFAVIQNQYSEGARALKEALRKGYPIKVAARDPELMPLWIDADLKKRFQSELLREEGPVQDGTW